MTFNFTHSEADTRRLAIFVAQLIKECVGFKVQQDGIGTEVTLTGGF